MFNLFIYIKMRPIDSLHDDAQFCFVDLIINSSFSLLFLSLTIFYFLLSHYPFSVLLSLTFLHYMLWINRTGPLACLVLFSVWMWIRVRVFGLDCWSHSIVYYQFSESVKTLTNSFSIFHFSLSVSLLSHTTWL